MHHRGGGGGGVGAVPRASSRGDVLAFRSSDPNGSNVDSRSGGTGGAGSAGGVRFRSFRSPSVFQKFSPVENIENEMQT